jgi:hypothetical protein
MWKGILSSRGIISLGAYHRIHKHSSLPIRDSAWVPSPSNFTPYPAPHFSSPPRLVVFDLISPNKSWNFHLFLSIFDAHSVKEIQKIPINYAHCHDFIWTPSTNGYFSFSLAYRLINNPRASASLSPLEPNIWKLL